MKFHRPERVSKLIREYLNEFLIREIEIPGVLLTITDVEVAGDMSRAVVRFSTLPSEAVVKVFKILTHARDHFQYELFKKLNIRPMPQIVFEIDRGPEQAAAVEKALLSDDQKS